jgi:oligopeptide transport system substrate-binding protein
VPVIPVYFYKRVFLISPRVKNWVPNILDNRAWQHIDLNTADSADTAKR